MASAALRIPGYARVRTEEGIRTMQISREGRDGIVGFRVRSDDGSRWESERAAQELLIVSAAQLVERLVLNTLCGDLEPEEPAIGSADTTCIAYPNGVR